jgi:biopolymer transport protein ExbD/biopolymer transport protein TolR
VGFRRRKLDSPHVDLTPMIDVVFLLLIFFMISTTFIDQPGLQIDLPRGGGDTINPDELELQVYLTEKGDIYLEREKVSLNELAGRLAGYSPEKSERMTFLLMADQDALHGRVIRLMDIAKTAGFGELAIATDRESPEAP